jgi:hypothetical protein
VIVSHSSIKHLLVLIYPKFTRFLFALRIKLISADCLRVQSNLGGLIVSQDDKKFSDIQNKFEHFRVG